MPEWNPLQIGLVLGIVCGSLWSVRTTLKYHHIAGLWMVIETRFWRSLVVGFAVTLLIVALLSSILATVVWLLHGVALRGV